MGFLRSLLAVVGIKRRCERCRKRATYLWPTPSGRGVCATCKACYPKGWFRQ